MHVPFRKYARDTRRKEERKMEKEQKGMDVFILLDRTGSMAPLWVEAVSSVNTYVQELKKDAAADRVTLAVFDTYEGKLNFDILRDGMPVGEWKNVGKEEVLPRGMTPLLDALTKLITRAEETNNEKTAIVVMTDGHENASREVTKEAVKATLDRVQEKNWQVNFLGANFDGFDQAGQLGVSRNNSMNFYIGHANVAMSSTAERHRAYRNRGVVVHYSNQDRAKAKEDEVK